MTVPQRSLSHMLIPDSVVASNEKTLRDKLRLKLETGQKAGLKVRDIKE